MRLRTAKKVGKTWPKRHRQKTLQRAMARIWKQDVRLYGIPGNMDCLMVMVRPYPSLGGKKREAAQ